MSNETYKENNNLSELRSSGFEIVDGEPDIRGWKARNAQGLEIGEIDELIFDAGTRKVRYLLLDVNGKPLNLISRKVLIPIGLAELHEENNDVILPTVTVGHLATLPDYKKGYFDLDTQRKIRTVFGGAAVTSGTQEMITDKDNDFYNHEHFDDERMYRNRKKNQANKDIIPVMEENVKFGKRIVQTGGVRVNTSIVNEPVEKNVNLKEEHITLKRNPVNKPADDENFEVFKESTIELPEHKEVPVISKEARIVEEISLNKDISERKETVRDTVRKTQVDIENIEPDDERQ